MMSPFRSQFRAHRFTAAINTCLLLFISFIKLNYLSFALRVNDKVELCSRFAYTFSGSFSFSRHSRADIRCALQRAPCHWSVLRIIISHQLITYVSINEQREPKMTPPAASSTEFKSNAITSVAMANEWKSHMGFGIVELCETFPQRVHFLNFIYVLELMCNEFQMHSVSVSRLNHMYVSQILNCVRIRTNSFCGRDL